ncbi:MAG: hypothetical protein WD749_02700 [Phycisphaerales bacterium]
MVPSWIRALLVANGVYDLVLGAAFLVAGARMYDAMGVTPPNHWGYVQFPAALVAVFGAAFLVAARAPGRHRDIVAMGVFLKLAYAGVVLGHMFKGSVPALWTVFGWIDLLMALLLAAAWSTLAKR